MNSLDPWRIIAIDAYGDVVYPRPYYGHPFYQEIPSWINYGKGDETRYLFDGAFVGADPAGVNMHNNNQRGITFKKELDERQILHVEICVDGKCYRTSMNLAPAISMIMEKMAQAHAAFHKGGDMGLAIDRAINVAGEGLIAMLADRHRRSSANSGAAVGNIFGDIGHALSSAANTVGGVLKDLKGPAAVAAGAAATAFGGPAAGPVAVQLTGALIDAAPGGHPATQASAQQIVAAAKQTAKTNPTVQTALDAAHHAASQTTMAALGHVPPIPAAPNTVAAAVQKFLPLATQAATGGGGGGGGLPTDLQSALSAFGRVFGSNGDAVSGWYDLVGAAIVDVRAHAQSIAGAHNANVVGVIRSARGVWQSRGFHDPDAGDDWLGKITRDPSSYTYAAVFDKTDVMWPYPLNEQIGTASGGVPIEGRPISTVSGA